MSKTLNNVLQDLAIGRSYELHLQGAKNQYEIVATVQDVSQTQLTLIAESGSPIKLPLDAIISASLVELASNPIAQVNTQSKIAQEIADGVAKATASSQLVDALLSIKAKLSNNIAEITSTASQARAATLIALSEDVVNYCQASQEQREVGDGERHLREIRNARLWRKYRGKSGKLSTELEVAFQAIDTLANKAIRSCHDGDQTPPRILAHDKINVTRGLDNEFDLPLRVKLDSAAGGVSDVRIMLDKYRTLKLVSGFKTLHKLQPGETPTLNARLRDTRRQAGSNDVRIEAHITYVGLDGIHRSSVRQNITVRLNGKEAHTQIENPFRAYAGGLPVDKSDMFFGREDIVQEFVDELSKPSGGMCYALYGQQRTGKSSVLEQVRSRLEKSGAVVASLSMGTLDRNSMTSGFVEDLLDQFRLQVDALLTKEQATSLRNHWPRPAAVEKRPLSSLQLAQKAARGLLKAAGKGQTPFVVVIDEFTYLHEVLRRRGIDPAEHNELRDFMRQLKGLLESRNFSALLVGQDTMPRFLEAYPNEFSVMTTRKLDYLRPEETRSLADEPILTTEGASRYSGYALDTIATYTDGHPYFTQILCDRIITVVNTKKRSEITQSDVEEAVESLLSGADCIEPHKFDCLVTADNTNSFLSEMDNEAGTDHESHRNAQVVLNRIAVISGDQNNSVHADSLQLDARQSAALTDLKIRGVIREADGKVAIRVLLYADYLRRRLA